jgi:transposase
LAVDAHGLPVKMIITDGNTADCTQAEALIDGLLADYFMADKAYDTNALLQWCTNNNCEAVIPPRRHRKDQRAYDKELYKLRHLVENAFLKLKQWRSIATRYAKTTKSFLAECQIAAIMLWLR